jgi:Zn-dependent protease with chaperone function
MRIAVYLPLLLPVFAAATARWLSGRMPPRRATWMLTATAVALALAGALALAALAATAIGQLPGVARVGHWSVPVLRREDPASVDTAVVAAVLFAGALASTVVTAVRRSRWLMRAARTARQLPTQGDGRLVVLADPAPDAYALPGGHGRIVVSTGMLDALDPAERRVLLAHEHAHLDRRHHVFVGLAWLAAAANPLLAPVARAVGYATERWADEEAAARTGDRRMVARTIGKAALLAGRRGAPRGALGITAEPSGFRRRSLPWRAGPVPLRVAALLCTPPRNRLLHSLWVLGLLALTLAACVETTRDLHAFFHLADLRLRHS